MKTAIIALLVIILLAFGGYYYMEKTQSLSAPAEPIATTSPDIQNSTSTPAEKPFETESVIGMSVNGNPIIAYHFGTGNSEILFVGGIHGGYEWNTVSVANSLIDYLQQHHDAIPQNETVTVIPVVNPDGLGKVVGTTTPAFSPSLVPTSASATVPGRFNAHTVDLNRNFDCDWQAKGTWQNTPVSGGTSAFSEPESQAIRDYVQSHTLTAAVVWYSSAGGVFASNCHDGVLPETNTLTTLYADASGYPAHESFDFYATTGDMVNWLAKLNIPAISVLLTNHTDVEWTKNQAGVNAVLQHYAQ